MTEAQKCLHHIAENMRMDKTISKEGYEYFQQAIKALEQEPKTGHWIVEVWNNKEHHTCSSCQHVVDYEPCYHYCPYCGAKMVEPQERSGEE